MKSNIDLTSNEMFSRESVSLQLYGLQWDMSKVAITKNDSDLIPNLPWGKPQEMRGQMETNPLFWD